MANQEFQFEDYEIEESLGAGSGGTLYRAYRARENAGRGRRDLIYRAASAIARDVNAVDAVRDRLERAASATHASLYASIRSTYDSKELVLVSEWCPGVKLSVLERRFLDSGERWSIAAALYIAGELAKALCHIHSRVDSRKGIALVHGQVNPDNVFITFDGQVKLLSLGMAAAENAALEGRYGHRDGLANYASPEQAAGKEIDGRSDLFSLGTLLWGLVTGRPLFAPSARDEWIRILSEKTPPPPTQANPEAPPELDNITAKLLDRDRHLRYELGERAALDIAAVLKFRYPEFTPAEFISVSAKHSATFRDAYQAFLDKRDDSGAQTKTKNYDSTGMNSAPAPAPVLEAVSAPLPAPANASFANSNHSQIAVEKPAERFRVSMAPVEGPRPTRIENSNPLLTAQWLKPTLAAAVALLVILPVAGPRFLRHAREQRALALKAKAAAHEPRGNLHLITKEIDFDLEINGKPVDLEDGVANVPANRELLVKVKKDGYEEIETITQLLPGEDLDLPLDFRKLASTDDEHASPASRSH